MNAHICVDSEIKIVRSEQKGVIECILLRLILQCMYVCGGRSVSFCLELHHSVMLLLITLMCVSCENMHV